MAESPFVRRVRRAVRDASSRAVDELLGAQTSTDALGAAVRRVQQGRRLLDSQGARLLGTLGLATQVDLDRVSQRIGRLRKRLEVLLDRVER